MEKEKKTLVDVEILSSGCLSHWPKESAIENTYDNKESAQTLTYM